MIHLEIYIFVGGFIRVVILALLRCVVLARRLRPYVFTQHFTVVLTASRRSNVLCLLPRALNIAICWKADELQGILSN